MESRKRNQKLMMMTATASCRPACRPGPMVMAGLRLLSFGPGWKAGWPAVGQAVGQGVRKCVHCSLYCHLPRSKIGATANSTQHLLTQNSCLFTRLRGRINVSMCSRMVFLSESDLKGSTPGLAGVRQKLYNAELSPQIPRGTKIRHSCTVRWAYQIL